MMRVVLDVNVIISAVIGPLGYARRVWLAWQTGHFALVTSDHIIREVVIKLRLPRIARRYGLTAEDVRLVEAVIRGGATVLSLEQQDVNRFTGDPEDDAVLATVRLGQADYLVTGDRGLLALKTHADAEILTPRAFSLILERLTDEQPRS